MAEGGWHHTGDLGRIDSQGRLFVLGRLRHQINRGGIRIDPAEVEEALANLSPFKDAAVISLDDDVLGEIVCVCAVEGEHRTTGLTELRDSLSAQLARHKLPERLCLVDEIPRTRMGKVDRTALRALVLARLVPHTRGETHRQGGD